MMMTPKAQEAITQMQVPGDEVPLKDAPNDEVHLQGHRKSRQAARVQPQAYRFGISTGLAGAGALRIGGLGYGLKSLAGRRPGRRARMTSWFDIDDIPVKPGSKEFPDTIDASVRRGKGDRKRLGSAGPMTLRKA